ncbi:MAG: NAD(P)/FAD-dependent oxidoreductase [Hyphomonadaceae bacterium]|nr:NAD(P)/FAD-dependent oxidoreductase [Hyphomonadaceae bacterium]
MSHFDSIIIGAGAAGLYCALHAGRRGKSVLVLEHNAEPGAKILISGGGRCNFTNLDAGDHTRYLSANPNFARSALSRHGPAEFIKLIEQHGVAYYEKTLGQLFCEGARASQKIVRLLLDECEAGGVMLRTNARVESVTRGETFQVGTSLGPFTSDTVVVAAGGLSIPKLGATSLAYDIAKAFDIPLVEPRPGLVPLTFAPADMAWMGALSGVSTPITASLGKARFREAALFTHRGLSGPAILQISSYWREGEAIEIDFLPDAREDVLAERKRERPKALLKTALAEILPDRLASVLAERLPQSALGDLKDQALIDAARALKATRITPNGTEGYAKAEVTVGGVDTNALSQQSMEARAVPGLFFIGECVDVTGWLGGYNFQWAWSSGWACAQAL